MNRVAKITVSLPPDRATIWEAIIVAMRPDRVCFADQVLASCPMSRDTLEGCLDALKFEGLVKKCGSTWKSFRVLDDTTPAPTAHPVHLNIWNAVRALRVFARDEVIVLATADLRKTEVLVAQEYFDALIAAGILIPHDGVEARVWRLKPSMNSGPRPPMMLRAAFVLDPNKMVAIGNVHAVEVRS